MQGLRQETANTNIRVVSIQPGATESELASHIQDPDVLAGGKCVCISSLTSQFSLSLEAPSRVSRSWALRMSQTPFSTHFRSLPMFLSMKVRSQSNDLTHTLSALATHCAAAINVT